MITLIHGPAELMRAEALARLRAALDDEPALLDVNTTVLDGRKASLAELQGVCDTMPFLSSHRLVIAEGFVRRTAGRQEGKPPAAPAEAREGEGKSAAEQSRQLLEYLSRVPETTELVLIEEEVVGGGPILRRLLELQNAAKARIVLCQKPSRNDLPGWIRGRAEERRLRLDAAAVSDLAEFVGDDLRQLDQELIKLANYAGSGRTVTRADVRLLVAATRAASIFDLVEALGGGDGARAARLLQHILDADGEQPLVVLTMIARQYRLLLQAKALQGQGARPPEVARTLGLPEWTVGKLLTQAKGHTFAGLQRSLEAVLATDEAIKTGRMGDREAMDVLLAQLAIA